MLGNRLTTLRNSLMAQAVATMIFMVVALLLMGIFAYVSNRRVTLQANHILQDRLPVSINALEMLDELNDIQLSLFAYAQGDIEAKSSYFKNTIEFRNYRNKLGINEDQQISGFVQDKTGSIEVSNAFDQVVLIDKLSEGLHADIASNVFANYDPSIAKQTEQRASYLYDEISRDILAPLLEDSEFVKKNKRYLDTLNAALTLQESVNSHSQNANDEYFRALQHIQTNSTLYCLNVLSLDCEYFTHKLNELKTLGEIYFSGNFTISQDELLDRLNSYDRVYFEPIQQALETLSTNSNILIRDEIEELDKRLTYTSFAVIFATITCLFLIFLLFSLIAKKMLRPLETVSNILTQLRQNNYYIKVPRMRRDNEVGKIYAGLRTLRNSLRELEEFRKKEFDDEKTLHDQQISEAYEALKKSETNLRNYSKQLETSNQDLEQFIHIASHDLREPLKNIMGTLQMIQFALKEMDPALKTRFDQIGNNIRRMEQLTNDMRALARMQNITDQPEICDMRAQLDIAISNNQNIFENRSVRFDIQPLPEITGHPEYLRIVFDQLLANAVQYGAKDLAIQLTASETNHHIEINFENNLDEEVEITQELLLPFKRGANANIESSGVGLTVCRKIVEGLHKGEIIIQEGTTDKFSVKLRFPK